MHLQNDYLEKKDVSGLEKFIEENGVNDSWFTENHTTPLLSTLLYKKYLSYDMSKMLVKYFDINNQDKQGKTVLFHAVIMGNLSAVKFFIANGGDVSIKDCLGLKASDYASMLDIQNSTSISRMLLSEENHKRG